MQQFSHRRTLLPFLAKHMKARSYLEIGVKGGKTFLPLKVWKKIAVDPNFRIKKDYKRSQMFSWLPNLWAKYYPCTSDLFFENHAADVLNKGQLDLAFIDGLHTYEQTYIDVVNTLPYLKKGGVLLLHDCSPKSESAAYPAESIDQAKSLNLPGWNGMWSGDVWKVVPRLQLSQPQLKVGVLDSDSGLGIVMFADQSAETSVAFDEAQIKAWDYAHLDANRKQLLNIIKPEQALEWLQAVFK